MARELIYPIKKLVNLTEEQAEKISAFRFDNRIASENEAVRRLIELGLAVRASGQLDVHFVDEGRAALLTGLGSAEHLEMRRSEVDQLRGFIEREQKKYPRL